MSKRQLIEEIRRYNTTAQPQFFAQFEESDLQQYLERLKDAADHTIKISSWSRKPKMRMVS